MIESGYYPIGEEYNENAPWNIIPKEEQDFDLNIQINCNTKITTKEYNLDWDGDSPLITLRENIYNYIKKTIKDKLKDFSINDINIEIE